MAQKEIEPDVLHAETADQRSERLRVRDVPINVLLKLLVKDKPLYSVYTLQQKST